MAFPGAPQIANPWGDWLKKLSPIMRNIFDTDLEAGFGAYKGMSNRYAPGAERDAFDRWLSNQYSNRFGEYQALAGTEPSLSWLDYLGGVDPMRQWNVMGDQQRGMSPGTFTPRTRWMR